MQASPRSLARHLAWCSVPGSLRRGLTHLVPHASRSLYARLLVRPARSSTQPRLARAGAPVRMAAAAAEGGAGGAKRIDGKAIAEEIRQELAAEVAKLKEATGQVPGLAVVLVGSRGDSETYVRAKRKACEELGIRSFATDLPGDVTQDALLKVVADYNADEAVHGILVQLPLPPHIHEATVLDAVSQEKDVDGFHPANVGALAMRGRTPLFVSCTPQGCIALLERSGVRIAGAHAVVLGRSNIVGTPAALLLQQRDATVTVVHSKTPDAKEVVRRADIVIAAIGKPELVRGDWVKPGAAVIDVGTNPVPDDTKKRGYRLVGDVAYAEVAQVAGCITPVPGGVGPMTITMLLSNTINSAKRKLGQS